MSFNLRMLIYVAALLALDGPMRRIVPEPWTILALGVLTLLIHGGLSLVDSRLRRRRHGDGKH